MTLTRKMLKAMGIEDEKIDQIIEEHAESVDALKKQRDAYKSDADKVESLERQLEEAKKNDGDDFKEKYEVLKTEFEEYKENVEAEKATAKIKGLYSDLLKEAGVDEKRIDAIIRVTDLTEIELNKDGSIKGADGLKEKVKEDWSDFIATIDDKGAKVDTPPDAGGKTMTKEEISKIKDPAERQKAIAENHELYGF